jgi:hypothetical protein
VQSDGVAAPRLEQIAVSGANSYPIPEFLRLDAVADEALSGDLAGRTPIGLLSDVVDLGENVTVGWISQAVIGHVLHGLGAKVMRTYHSWDLELPSGDEIIRVEVKTSSATQSWPSKHREPQRWGCGRASSVWDPDLGRFTQQSPPRRLASIYIFVARDGAVFASSSYQAVVLTTVELEALLVKPSRHIVTRAELTREHLFRNLHDLPAEVTETLRRLELQNAAPQDRPASQEHHASS